MSKSSKRTIVIYGSYGYTGVIITEIAAASGHPVLLAGRDAEKLAAQSARLNLPHRVAGLNDPDTMDTLLADALLVIHCAGPFMFTWKAMAEACLRNSCHYLDITGEIDVFESLKKMDGAFRAAGIMAMPGTGFDVVPSDCLAMLLKERLPDANTLELAFVGIGGGVSHGTATSMAERAGMGGAIRRDGRLKPVPSAYLVKEVDFGRGPKPVVSIPWGDLSTAFTSTGIGNITVYTAVNIAVIRMLKLSNFMNPVLRTGFVRGLIKKWIDSRPPGPTPEQRERGKSMFRGRVTNAAGETSEAGLITPEGYRLTALTAWHIAMKVAAGNMAAGYQTPASAYGKELIFEIEGCREQEVSGSWES
ncbi:MAG: saccharopine dehydrogenase family protein [Cyclonatronaceae bacterium]